MIETIEGMTFRGEETTWDVDFGGGYTEDHGRFRIRAGRYQNQPIVQKIRVDGSDEARALLAHEISIGIRLRRRLPGDTTYPRELTRLLGYDRDDQDATFMLMTASGTRLDRVGRIPDWSKFAASLFRGLRWLEVAGVVHRDLTPQNVFWDAESQIVHIIDFGLAKVAGRPRDPGGVGRYPWSSPEQHRGIGKVSVDDDIYSAGLLVYQMATGVPEETLPPAPEALADADPQLRRFLTGIFEIPPPTATAPNPRPPGTRTILVDFLGAEDIRPPSRSPDRFEEGREQFDHLVERKQEKRASLPGKPNGPAGRRQRTLSSAASTASTQLPRERTAGLATPAGAIVTALVLVLVVFVTTLVWMLSRA